MDINFLREKIKNLSEDDLHPNHSLSMTTIHEKKFLHEVVKLLKPKSVLVEIGCYSGGSISIMANSNVDITAHTIDLFWMNGTDIISRNKELERVKGFLTDFNNITVHSGNACVDFKWWDTPIDLLFNDGPHEEPSLTNAMEHWLPFLKPGGILLIHDNHVYFPEVQDYVKKLIESEDFYQLDQVDTLAVFIKRKK